MRLLVILTLMLLSAPLVAADDRKAEVALNLHRAVMAIDAPKLVDAIMSAILKQTGEEFPAEVQAEMKSLLTEIVMSDEYAEAKAEAYAAVFSLEEMEQLLAMVNTPIFKKYQSALPALTNESNQRLNALIASNQPRIQRQLREAWKKSGGQ